MQRPTAAGQYSGELRCEAVAEILDPGVSIDAVAHRHSIDAKIDIRVLL